MSAGQVIRTNARPARAAPDLVALARPVFIHADALAQSRRGTEAALLAEAAELLDQFGHIAERAGAVPQAVAPARIALAVLLDQAVRANRALDVRAWSGGAGRLLFDGRDASVKAVRRFRAIAQEQGSDYASLVDLLDEVLARVDRATQRTSGAGRRSWALVAAGLFILFVLSLAAYALFLETRYHARLFATFEDQAAQIAVDAAEGPAELARRLNLLREATSRVRLAAAGSPLGTALELPVIDSARRAEAVYTSAVAERLPPALASALGVALATEGGNLEAYDTLRAWSILQGRAEWSGVYLSGWLEDRGGMLPDFVDLAPSLAALSGPPANVPPPDPELVDQARDFALGAEEAARAWLELRRSPGATALAPWQPEAAVPGMTEVLQRRSGLPIETPVPGIFTAEGWTWARNFGAGLAVQRTREVSVELMGTAPPQQNDAPDRVMDRLQRETTAYWQDYLADLRVRPFLDRSTSIRVSGLLAAPRSPLTELLREVWIQVGGTDRRRSHEQQLRLATTFGPAIGYVEAGKMAEIAALFSSLNVALGAVDTRGEADLDRLMSLQDRGRSVGALGQAPLIVVQIVEDVLAQTSAAHTSTVQNPLVRSWQTGVLPICRGALVGRYPFADGSDADPAEVAALLAPGGAIDRFFSAQAQRYVDTATSPWRWKPEARFTGLSPESAVFFQRAMAISDALFGPEGRLGADLTLSALAERGQAVVAVGGVGAPIRAGGAAEQLAWPGPEPGRGVEVAFRTGDAAVTLGETGPWGLFRLLDGLRLRPRDEGRRFLVDVRTEAGRLFVEMAFAEPANPVAARALLRGFDCPAQL